MLTNMMALSCNITECVSNCCYIVPQFYESIEVFIAELVFQLYIYCVPAMCMLQLCHNCQFGRVCMEECHSLMGMV